MPPESELRAAAPLSARGALASGPLLVTLGAPMPALPDAPPELWPIVVCACAAKTKPATSAVVSDVAVNHFIIIFSNLCSDFMSATQSFTPAR
jgi:hypothetical protein